MKNIIITTSFILLLIFQSLGEVSIQIEDFIKKTDQSFSARVYVSTGEEKIGALNFDVLYDKEVIKLTSNKVHSMSGFTNTSTPGKIKFGGIKANGLQGDQTVLLLNFQPVGSEGDVTNLKLTLNQIADVNGRTLSYTKKDGSLTLKNIDWLIENTTNNDLNNTCNENLINGFTYPGLGEWISWAGNARTISVESNDADNIYMGNSALELPSGYEDGVYYQTMFEYYENAETEFHLEAYAKFENPMADGWAGIGVHYYDESYAYLNQQSITVNGNQWTNYNMPLQAPENTKWIRVWVYKTTGGTAYFDEICFSNNIRNNTNCNGSLISTNSGFEMGDLSKWSNWDNTSITGNAYEGNYAGIVKDNTGGGFYDFVSINPSKNYVWKAIAKKEGAVDWAGIGVHYYDVNSQYLKTDATEVTGYDYEQYQLVFTPPNNAAFVLPWFWKNGGGNLLVDNFCLNKKPVCTEKKGLIWSYDDFKSKFNGVAKDPNIMDKFNIGWYINYAGSATTNYNGNAEYVKINHRHFDKNNIYSHFCHEALIEGAEEAYFLGYNEPENMNQADMTVDLAIEHWKHMNTFNGKLGSPCTFEDETDPHGWFAQFMDKVEQRPDLRVDFLQVHYYPHVLDINHLKKYLHTLWVRYEKPIWITEWNLAPNYWDRNQDGQPEQVYYSLEEQEAFMKQAIPLLESLEYVERYAWFGLYGDFENDEWKSNLLDRETDELTALGKAYKDLTASQADCERMNRLTNSALSETMINRIGLPKQAEKLNLSNFEISPNPGKGLVNITFDALESTTYKRQVLSLDGKIFINDAINVNANANAFQLNIKHLPAGLYMFKLYNDEHSYVEKIQVLH